MNGLGAWWRILLLSTFSVCWMNCKGKPDGQGQQAAKETGWCFERMDADLAPEESHWCTATEESCKEARVKQSESFETDACKKSPTFCSSYEFELQDGEKTQGEVCSETMSRCTKRSETVVAHINEEFPIKEPVSSAECTNRAPRRR